MNYTPPASFPRRTDHPELVDLHQLTPEQAIGYTLGHLLSLYTVMKEDGTTQHPVQPDDEPPHVTLAYLVPYLSDYEGFRDMSRRSVDELVRLRIHGDERVRQAEERVRVAEQKARDAVYTLKTFRESILSAHKLITDDTP
jgi:hypothetical protein